MEEELRQVRQMPCVANADFDDSGLFKFVLKGLGEHQVLCCEGIYALLSDEDVTLQPGSLRDIVEQVYALKSGAEHIRKQENAGDISSDPSMESDFYQDESMDSCSALSRDPTNAPSPLLKADVELYKTVFGQSSVKTDAHPNLDTMEITLEVPLPKSLDELTCNAWGLESQCPISIQVCVNLSTYTEHYQAPKFKCFQSTRHSPVAAQMQQILKTLCMHWPKYPQEDDPQKAVPPRTQGFLVQVAEYVCHRLPTCSSFCVNCDQRHVFNDGGMLKPAVCARDLCAFQFQELNLGTDAAEDIAADAGVVDMLVCFAQAASKSHRATDVFSPFPQVVDPENPKKLAFSPANPDYDKLKLVLSQFPSVQYLSQAKDHKDLQHRVSRAHRLASPLLQWIIHSNRSHILKIPDSKQVSKMATPHQYLLVTAPPKQQQRFRELKAQYGSKFAFHGSPIENWHCILREGLKSASGTKLQLHGAALGNGVYLAPEAGTSFGYCQGGYDGRGSNKAKNQQREDQMAPSDAAQRYLGRNPLCLALCEVINKDIKDCGWAWVTPDPEHVITRFFFVFDTDENGRRHMDTARSFNVSHGTNLEDIKKALELNGIA
jgi:hypothetical protein